MESKYLKAPKYLEYEGIRIYVPSGHFPVWNVEKDIDNEDVTAISFKCQDQTSGKFSYTDGDNHGT